MLEYLLATNSIDTVAVDFTFDLLKVLENNLFLNHLADRVQIVNKPIIDLGCLLIMFT